MTSWKEKITGVIKKEKTFVIILFFLFLFSVMVRFCFADFTKILQVYNDELYYWDIARGFNKNGEILVRNLKYNFTNILYSFILSPVFFIDNVKISVKIVALINSILMSSVVFPVYFLSKKVCKTNFSILLSLLLILTLPDMTYSITFMSENSFLPIITWCFYFMLLSLEFHKKQYWYGIWAAVLAFLAYFNKEVAAYLVVAYVLFHLVLLFRIYWEKQKNWKECFLRQIKVLGIFIFIFLLGYILKLYFIAGESSTIYTKFLNVKMNDIYYILFFIYALLHNFMFAVISFFIFPIMIYFFAAKKMNSSQKNLYLLALFALIIGVSVTTYMISMNEDFGSDRIAQHLRYISPIIIPFLIITISLLAEDKIWEREYSNNEKNKIWMLIIGFSFAVFLLCSRIKPGSHVSQTLLKYYTYFYERFNYIFTYEDMPVTFDGSVLIYKICVIVGCVIITKLIFSHKGKSAFWIFIILMFFINIWNNALAIKSFRIYQVEEEKVDEMILLNQWLKDIDGNILVLMEDFGYGGTKNGLVDTYLYKDKKMFYSTAEDLLLQDKEKIDLKEESIPSVNRTFIEKKAYHDVQHIEYILEFGIGKKKQIVMENVEGIEIPGISVCNIYKNRKADQICFSDALYFPNVRGEKRVIFASDNVFYSQQDYSENGNYKSTAAGGALIYGPYCDVPAGEYLVRYYYAYEGEQKENTVIGTADIMMQGNFEYQKIPITADANFAELHVLVNEDCTMGEFRISTNAEGVLFDRIEIINIGTIK